MNAFEAMRRFYGVPVKRGARIRYVSDRTGTIISSEQGAMRFYVRFDGDKSRTGPFHPTWGIEYLDGP